MSASEIRPFGTLTQNKLTLGDPFCASGIRPEEVILAAALVSRAEDEDPIDLAVLSGSKDHHAVDRYLVTHFQPFDPVHKRTEAVVKGSDKIDFRVAKGAVQMILEISANVEQVTSAVDAAVKDFAARGFRSLGVARTDEKGTLRFWPRDSRSSWMPSRKAGRCSSA